MSWPAAYPPPPRQRSRSPPRGGYPARSYPDHPYPQESYHSGWDAYDRERAWANYERDRAMYEYDVRRRSPPVDDGNRKRRRSLSPYERDRYDPRPRHNEDYDAHSRGHGYGSPRRGQHQASHNRRCPPDPHTFDYPGTLKQYAEWFRYYFPQQAIEEDNADKAAEQESGDGSKPRNGIKSRWEKYKKEFFATQLQTLFEHHRKSPWFAEKYDPSLEMHNLRLRVRKVGWKGRIHTFLRDLEAGAFDNELRDPEPEATAAKETSVNGDSALNGTSHLDDVKPSGDDEMQFVGDVEEEAVELDVPRPETNGKFPNDRRFLNRGEEISALPEGNQVMIRTIPPDIGRVKLEESCGKVSGFMYLALGDPLQKRNYYRAGWIKFTEDADMSRVLAELTDKKIEGFKLHTALNNRPFINRIRYAPEVASRPERVAKDLASVKALAVVLEEEAEMLRSWKRPAPAPASNEVKAEEPDSVMVKSEDVVEEEEIEPLERGSDAVERHIERLMNELRDQGLVDPNDEKPYESRKNILALDLYIAYIRAAYHCCYYCSVVTDHVEELQRKCIRHKRRPLIKSQQDEGKVLDVKEEKPANGEEKEKEPLVAKDSKDREGKDRNRNDDRWLDWLDNKIALLANKNGVDPKEYGGKNYDEELQKSVEPHVKQEDEGKFRCRVCQKLFKATSFVEKHIANKHSEFVKNLDDIPYFNNFALDPHRIQPFAHPPPSTGNNQGLPPQAYGIQGPVPPPSVDYGRPPPPYYGHQSNNFPPPQMGGGYWDYPGYQYGPSYPQPAPPLRRDEATTARRLTDRIGGFAPGYDQPQESVIPATAGLPPKPAASVDSGSGGGRKNYKSSNSGPLPPPPADVKEDPRASAGKKVSYYDMDNVAEGDVELNY